MGRASVLAAAAVGAGIAGAVGGLVGVSAGLGAGALVGLAVGAWEASQGAARRAALVAALRRGESLESNDALFLAAREAVGRAEAQALADRTEGELGRELLAKTRVGVLLIDKTGEIQFANEALREMVPLRKEPVGSKPLEVIAVIEVHEAVTQVLGGGEVQMPCVVGPKDLVLDASAVGEWVFVRLEDVTGQREAERARTDFVANVSHELRTPVTALMGFAETILLDRDRIPDDIVGMVEVIDRNARRLSEMFQDLLRLHRIEARRRELPLEFLELRSIVGEAVGSAADRAAVRKQSFLVTCEPGAHGWVHPEALTAILQNLASNASAYTPEGGAITVAVRSDPMRIEIEDNGLGIDPSHHERIFERFYRVDDARSRAVGGTGLGLAIVKHFARASRCDVTLNSELGEGTTFTVTLPASG